MITAAEIQFGTFVVGQDIKISPSSTQTIGGGDVGWGEG